MGFGPFFLQLRDSLMKSLLIGTPIALIAALFAAADPTGAPRWQNPEIQAGGEIVVLPQAGTQPVAGSKAVIDCTAQKSATEVAKGLTKAARWINLNAAAGVGPSDIHVVVVLHGDATKAALTDEGYSQFAEASENPNRRIIQQLQKAGVEIHVCGQALAHRKYPTSAVLPEVRIATAALTVLVEAQRSGHAFLPD